MPADSVTGCQVTSVKREISFRTGDGVLLRGWHVVPGSGDGPFPTVVMAHGLSAVIEMGLQGYATVFAEHGIASVVFDNRCFGHSEGEPRQEADPMLQVRDYRDAVTFAESLPETDAGRIGAWGSSFSGGHVLCVAAWDRRVRCVVSQVPVLSGRENARRLVPAQVLEAAAAGLRADRAARFAGGEPAYLPVVSDVPGPAMMPTPDSYDWFTEVGAGTSWQNRLTLRTTELADEYEPMRLIDRVSPTPLLMIVALRDSLCPTEVALRSYHRALEPKRLITVDAGHFDLYAGAGFDMAARAGAEWFRTHLA